MLREKFEQYENASLRKIAQATNLNYQTMLKKSKEPVPGREYNPDEINYQAVEDYIAKRGVEIAQLDWEALNENTRTGRTASLSKSIEDFHVGDQVYLRTNATTPYEILFITGTHIVLMLEGTEEPLSWSHSTFFFKGPQFEPRTVSTEVEVEVEVEQF